MTKTFNVKVYQGKDRVYSAVAGAPRVSRLWVWDGESKQYRTPDRGNIFYAARYANVALGKRKRVYGSFSTLNEARTWQMAECTPVAPAVATNGSVIEPATGLYFHEVIEEWRWRRFPQLAYGTQLQYDRILRVHFGSLVNLRIHEITPALVDRWLDERKAASTSRRHSFEHELTLLSTILRYYVNYHDDASFQFPIKQRHREAIALNRPVTPVSKDLSEEEFLKFREQLRQRKNGEILSALATVQYYQALRISEAAGIYWEDVVLNWEMPQNSRIKIVRSVCYPHKGGQKAFVKGGFKNAKANGGMKEQPMFPESFEALASLWRDGSTGLIFTTDGEPLPYKIVQWQFDTCFKKAELPYRGTHVMRHGGCRRVFNENGELPIAQQLLGNTDLKTTLVYAKRQASALTKVAHSYWDKRPLLLANACKPKSES